MPTRHEATHDGAGLRAAIIQARFNRLVGEKLTTGAIETLAENGVADDAIDVYFVPGAFELAACAKRLSDRGQHDVIICLGVVIRGDTPHFDYVCCQAARGIADVAFESSAGIAFGVLTTDDMNQAFERAGGKVGNKGHEAALAALEMCNLYRRLDNS